MVVTKALKSHKLANLFPLIEGDEFWALIRDIKDNGLLEPIVLYKDQILDGRNRYRACENAGVDPIFTEYEGKFPLSHVLSLNVRRRMLSSTQAAMIASNPLVLGILEAEAKERQGETSVKDFTDVGRATKHAADAFDTNHQYVSQAKFIREKAPELVDIITEGRLPMPQAHALAKILQPSIRSRALVRVTMDRASLDETIRIIRDESPKAPISVKPDKNQGGPIIRIMFAIGEIQQYFNEVQSRMLLEIEITKLERIVESMKDFAEGLEDDRPSNPKR